MLNKCLGHLRTVLIHKWWVFTYCRRLGIPLQGITHDLSKLSWTEFSESARYYQGGKKSPIPTIKAEKGYSLAWQHHKGRNPHHYEYWTDNYSKGTTFIKIPFNLVLEMVADWLSAGRTYNGKAFTLDDEIDWWKRWPEKCAINPETVRLIDNIFETLRNKGYRFLREHKEELKARYENTNTQ